MTAALAGGLASGLAAAPLTAQAGDYNQQDFPVGNRAMVFGGAFTALGNDPSGVFYNPAGLIDSSRANVSISASLYGFDLLEVEASGEADSTFRIVPGAVGAVLTSDWAKETKRAPLAVGFTVLSPIAGERLSVSADESRRQRGLSVEQERNKTVRNVSDEHLWIGAGAGMALSDRLSVGASAFILHRTMSLTEQITWINTLDDEVRRASAPADYESETRFYDAVARLDTSDQSFIGIVGAKLRLDRMYLGLNVRLPGVPLRSRASARHSEFASTDARAPTARETSADSDDARDAVRSETHLPGGGRLGWAWIEPGAFTVSCDLSVDLPSRQRRLFFDDPALQALFHMPSHVDRRLIANGACGFELLVRDGLSVAVGAFTDRSAVANGLRAQHGDASEFEGQLEDVDLYGGTFSLGLFGEHSLTRVGVTANLGNGRMSSFSFWDDTWRVHEVRRSSAYVFVASTFRY